MLAQKVLLLEALKAQHEEHQALLQTQLADAHTQLADAISAKESMESIAAAAAASADGKQFTQLSVS